MNALRRLATVVVVGGAVAWSVPSNAAARQVGDVARMLTDARSLTRQMRFDEAEWMLRHAVRLAANTEQTAYAHLLLGIVAHERRDADAAEREYRRALEITERPETRATAQSNLDMLAAERVRYAAYAPLLDRLDAWLAVECLIALLVGGIVVRVSRIGRVGREGRADRASREDHANHGSR